MNSILILFKVLITKVLKHPKIYNMCLLFAWFRCDCCYCFKSNSQWTPHLPQRLQVVGTTPMVLPNREWINGKTKKKCYHPPAAACTFNVWIKDELLNWYFPVLCLYTVHWSAGYFILKNKLFHLHLIPPLDSVDDIFNIQVNQQANPSKNELLVSLACEKVDFYWNRSMIQKRPRSSGLMDISMSYF